MVVTTIVVVRSRLRGNDENCEGGACDLPLMYAPVPVLNGGLRRHSGSPPAGEDDGKKHTRHSRRSCFVISAEGGNDEQWSEAGIQLKCASGVARHNRRLRRRKDVSNAIGAF